MEMVQTTRGRKGQISFWEAEGEVKYFLAKHKNFLTKTYVLKLFQTNSTKNMIFSTEMIYFWCPFFHKLSFTQV